MRVYDIFRRFRRIPNRLHWEVRSWIFPIPAVCSLWLTNRLSYKPLTQVDGLVVSMTSHGRRLRTVYLAIESIGRGSVLPSRVILWIDDEQVFKDLPRTLRRLVERGLEVKSCRNYGPHKKYYPYLLSTETFDTPLVTADDDVFYPRDWLRGFVLASEQYPDVVNCYKARVMSINGGNIDKYEHWGLAASTEARFDHVATGVAGVSYPPACLRALRDAGDDFIENCPKCDDLWLHAQAIRAGFKIRQIRSKPLMPLSIPGAESVGLWKVNLFGGNDRQVALTYTKDDIRNVLSVANCGSKGRLGEC